MKKIPNHDQAVAESLLGGTIGLLKVFGWLGKKAFQGASLAYELSKDTSPKFYSPEVLKRFEHTHVCAGSGWGKTQLMQNLILYQDLRPVLEGKRSIIVIDSQGDMLRNILRMNAFAPSKQGLSERLVLIDPTDIDHLPCLNLFDFGLNRIEGYSSLEKEKLINSAIFLYEYMFGALLGAELTQKQGVIFRYLARLMMVVPGATINTLMEFMRNPDAARPHIAKLDETRQQFFNTHFYASAFDNTRQQILTRLWGLHSNTVLSRMFSHPQNKLNLFSEMSKGRIILINTAKDLLKQDGTEILGRFIIALISHAVQERAALEENARLPTFVYIDEAQDYFSGSIEGNKMFQQLLSQSRKYNCGIVFAHQNLGQLDRKLQASIRASTATKIAGGVSAADAVIFAREMGVTVTADEIQALQKDNTRSRFMKFYRNDNPPAKILNVEFGHMEKFAQMSDEEYENLIGKNRQKYCTPWDARPELSDIPDNEFTLGLPKAL